MRWEGGFVVPREKLSLLCFVVMPQLDHLKWISAISIAISLPPCLQVMFRDGTYNLPGEAEGTGWTKVRREENKGCCMGFIDQLDWSQKRTCIEYQVLCISMSWIGRVNEIEWGVWAVIVNFNAFQQLSKVSRFSRCICPVSGNHQFLEPILFEQLIVLSTTNRDF